MGMMMIRRLSGTMTLQTTTVLLTHTVTMTIGPQRLSCLRVRQSTQLLQMSRRVLSLDDDSMTPHRGTT